MRKDPFNVGAYPAFAAVVFVVLLTGFNVVGPFLENAIGNASLRQPGAHTLEVINLVGIN
jgi:hypothetical protein